MVVTRRKAAALVLVAMATLGAGAAPATAGAPGATAAVSGPGVVPGPGPGIAVAPEADVSHHGHVLLWGSGLGVWMRSENRGPSNLADVTVRVRTSVPLVGRQEIPENCMQTGRQTVLCRTGELRADGAEEARRRQFAFELQLAGKPDEVVVRIDTLWNGGATDRNPRNNDHEVLAPATGDEYVF
ncbi:MULTISPECIES: hypothetical protein [unclassified Streptomyces]|uniref:hypothetical protein n=1 Tax=unclassified Streptomyces TaxID=2593676 RepID=UPI001652BE9B|nr:hypothetical protein [Streptomyces sp. sk2.1]